jgi:plasmid maintenance system antidote protein VapI
MDANGTAWRMRSLVSMGHDATRIARALNVAPDAVRRLIRGDCKTVTVTFHLLACRL